MKEVETGIDITLEVVCGKWKGLILWKLLHEEAVRFNELRRSIDGDISSRILSRELHKLIEDGLIERIDYETMPPKVEYQITPYGQTTASFLEIMKKSEMADIINEEEVEQKV
ncbi:winged helix-turn-helix transcriptional regulator [Halobacillus amylolyticus]|uniref:Helix-turn-helix transcriptional regulator n=1 Tax=Halobacillus amylolyticus TaxID=2932259 RepID=A0ABY4H7V2_9BACI|nr:helix-turn-helix domain-containing protein [Halobacillus amylolyticus]UOR10944.1 helix-turn-helix transcriptional regulator [Halobacillus amylolyticus]